MSSPRPFSTAPAAILSALLLLLLGPGRAVAQQPLPIPPPPPVQASGKDKLPPPPVRAVDVPIFDTPPSLALPKSRQVRQEPAPTPPSDKPASGTPAVQSVPLPAFRPVPPTLPAGASEVNDSSTSIHGQFVVHGADLESRTYITHVCEEVAEEMTVLLRDPEPFGIPVVVSVKTPPNVTPGGPAVSTDIAQLAYGGFRLQITIQVRPDFNVNDFRAELARMLVAQRILRGNKELTTQRTRILPDWLLVGVKEAMRYRSRSRPSAVFASVFRTGKIYGIEEILETTPGSLDALSRTLYETSCCALVLTLLDQPEGNLRMAKFLHGLATDSKSDREMLNRWFPGLNASKSSLNKWWSLQLASLATPTVFETLGPSETAKELDRALQLHYQTTPADVPIVHLPSTNDPKLNADAENESSKREKESGKPSFLARIFSSDKGASAAEDTPPKTKPGSEEKVAPREDQPKPESKKPGKTETAAKITPQAAKPKAEPKSQGKLESQNEEKPTEKPASDEPAKPGFHLRNLFGFGNSADGDKAKKDNQPEASKEAKVEPKKEAKADPKKEAKADPKKEAKADPKKEAKAEPKKEAKGEPKKETKAEPKKEAKAEPKKEAKAEPKKEASAPDPKAEAVTGNSDETKKPSSFFGRFFGSKSDDIPAKEDKKTEPPVDKSKAKDKPKTTPKKDSETDKPTAASADASLLLRAVADVTIPGLSIVFNAAQWFRDDQPHYAFLGFSKKKEPDSPVTEEAVPAKKDDKKPEPKKEPKPKVEEPKSPPKKEQLISVSIPLSDYSSILKRSDAKLILTNTATRLAALSTRAHPLFRPLINDYIELIADISKHKTKDADARLKALQERRDQVLAQAKAVRDHLDWYEASESNDYSGSFDDYLRLSKTIDQEIPRRADPISKLLDEIEKQAEN